MIKTFNLNEVKNTDVVVVDLMIKNIELKTIKNNKLFIEGEGVNNNLTIGFKMWDATIELFDKIKNIEFLRIKGLINEYLGNKQLIIENYKEIPKEHVHINDYIPSTSLNITEIKQFFNEIINNINNENYKNIINELLIDEFYKSLINKTPFISDCHTALAAVSIVNAIQHSKGRSIKIER